MNPITERLKKGTFGELLVQLKFLQYNVQAAPPLKDSGNDLIAIRGESFRAVQVKTRTINEGEDRISVGNMPEFYHILAIVVMDPGAGKWQLSLDRCRVFLLESSENTKSSYSIDELERYEIGRNRIDQLF